MLEIQASGTLFHDPMFFLQTNRTTILIPSQAQSSGTKLCTIWTYLSPPCPAPAMLIGIIVLHLHAQLHIYTINLFIYDLT